ncbi:unnamed protein product, partial [Prorocentrum cordatum]
ALSQHLGKPFVFDRKTALGEPATPEGRLANIADFLTEYCDTSVPRGEHLRVLVLEDFHIIADPPSRQLVMQG